MVIMNNHVSDYRNTVISCYWSHLSKTAKSHCHELLSDIKTENHTTTHRNFCSILMPFKHKYKYKYKYKYIKTENHTTTHRNFNSHAIQILCM